MLTKSYQDIHDEVVSIIAKTLGCSSADMHESSAIADLSADSIQLFELLLAFEEAYKVETTYDDVVRLHTVGDIVAYVARIKYAHE